MLMGKKSKRTNGSLISAKQRLIYLCKDIIEDGIVDQDEAEHLEVWLTNNSQLLGEFPANIISTRLFNQLDDGKLDKHEAGNLLRLLQRVVEDTEDEPLAPLTSTPYDIPQPKLDFTGFHFCLVGKFALGTAKTLSVDIQNMGGTVAAEITQIPGDTPAALVIGYFADKACQQGNCSPVDSAAISTAIQFRAQGKPVAIISEEHLMDQLIHASGFSMD